MQTLSSLLSPLRTQLSTRNSVSIYRRAGLIEGEGEGEGEGGGERGGESQSQRSMMKMEEQEPAELSVDINVLLNRDSRRKRQTLVFLLLVSLLIFLVAFLLGYITFRKTCKTCSETGSECARTLSEDQAEGGASEDDEIDVPEEKELYWEDLKTMLKKYLDKQELENNIRRLSEASHPSGSEQQEILSQFVYKKLQSHRLNHVWSDSHYVNLPFPNSLAPNYVRLVEGEEIRETMDLEDPEVYCAYSAQGQVTGGLVYAYYGREDDYLKLMELNVSVSNHTVIVRIGNNSFAEKVAVAQRFGAVGVLIYPDPLDIRQSPRELGLFGNISYTGHVHLGTGDPFTPGFPSFNHTQFPPVVSSALPRILAQPISANIAMKLIRKLWGVAPPVGWRGSFPSTEYRLGPGFLRPELRLRVGVNNVMKSTMIHNVFGSIEGLQEPDRYIILGAQRDAWGPGAAKSGVGTAILLELAHAFSEMIVNGFKPRRSLLFASWDAGEFGSVGATEWLEGYLTMMHLKAVAYINLDRAVLGTNKLSARSSPLLHSLIRTIIKQVDNPRISGQSLYDMVSNGGNQDWIENVIKPLTMASTTFPFIAFAGVPAVELSFEETSQPYLFADTKLDTFDALNKKANRRLAEFSRTLAETLGLMAVKLSHEKLLSLDYKVYSDETLKYLERLEGFSKELQSFTLTLQWLFTARGDFSRAAERLTNLIKMSNDKDERLNRIYNDKIMRVEFYFLSQYVSATDSPFRHILHGRGNHTLESLHSHFQLLRSRPQEFNQSLFRKQLALATWTLQGAANALSGDLWNIDNSNF